MEMKVTTLEGKAAGSVTVSDAIFGLEPRQDLIQQFEATWDDEQWAMHLAAEKCTTSAYELAWGLIADRFGWQRRSVGELHRHVACVRVYRRALQSRCLVRGAEGGPHVRYHRGHA